MRVLTFVFTEKDFSRFEFHQKHIWLRSRPVERPLSGADLNLKVAHCNRSHSGLADRSRGQRSAWSRLQRRCRAGIPPSRRDEAVTIFTVTLKRGDSLSVFVCHRLLQVPLSCPRRAQDYFLFLIFTFCSRDTGSAFVPGRRWFHCHGH